MTEIDQKVWFITGSSRGLGRSIAIAALEAGDKVFATSRKSQDLNDLVEIYGESIAIFSLDVTDAKQAKDSISAAVQAFGRIDVLVNNAGYGLVGAFEEMTDQEFQGQIDTNFWGVVHVTRAALPTLHRQGFGHILQITSIGGRSAHPGFTGYQSAKFAVEGFSESLSQEIAPLGIKMTIVEPGGIYTDWAGASMSFAEPMPSYEGSVGQMRKMMQTFSGQENSDPDKAAQVLLKLVRMDEVPLRLPLGSDAIFILENSYAHSLSELRKWESLTRQSDRDDIPPFDGPALMKAMGHN